MDFKRNAEAVTAPRPGARCAAGRDAEPNCSTPAALRPHHAAEDRASLLRDAVKSQLRAYGQIRLPALADYANATEQRVLDLAVGLGAVVVRRCGEDVLVSPWPSQKRWREKPSDR